MRFLLRIFKHRVILAFDLSNEEFLTRYGFIRPDPEKSSNVVLTCSSGRRVLVADQILKAKGYPNLRIYSGSFKDWLKNQGEITFGQFDSDYEVLEKLNGHPNFDIFDHSGHKDFKKFKF